MNLPTVLFGILSLVAAFLVLMLPETLNRTLPQTIEDTEQMGLSWYDFVRLIFVFICLLFIAFVYVVLNEKQMMMIKSSMNVLEPLIMIRKKRNSVNLHLLTFLFN